MKSRTDSSPPRLGAETTSREEQFYRPLGELLVEKGLCALDAGELPKLSEFDRSKPIMRWITDTQEIALNSNRVAFMDHSGARFCGHDNMFMEIEKPLGREKAAGRQLISLISNHGETGAWVVFHYVNGHFGELRPLSKVNIDGHGDEMRAITSVPWDMETAKDKSFVELALENDRIVGISSFHASLVEAGVYDPERWHLKTLVDRWDATNDFFYRERPRFIGSQNSTMQFDCEVEAGVTPDGAIAESVPDVVDIDIDYLYYVEDPREIAIAIVKAVKVAFHAPMVNIIPSPGWLDQPLALIYEKLHIELLKPALDSTVIGGYMKELVERLEQLAADNEAEHRLNIRKSGTLYSRFLNLTESSRTEIAAAMAVIVLERDNPEAIELELAHSDPDPGRAEVSFYYRPLGTMRERQERSAAILALELEHRLLPALMTSELKVLQQAGAGYQHQPATTAALLKERTDALPDIPGERMAARWKELAPVDYMIAKLAHEMRENLSGSEEQFGTDLSLMLGILKSDQLTPSPSALKHSVLSFLSRLGTEIGFRRGPLFSYFYSNFQLNLSEADNWRGRIASINGVYAHANLVPGLRHFSVQDIASVLEVDGGGSVRMEIYNHQDSGQIELSFSTCGQRAPEIYAHALATGFVRLDKPLHQGGCLVASKGYEGNTHMVLTRNCASDERQSRLRPMIYQWTFASNGAFPDGPAPHLAGAIDFSALADWHWGTQLARARYDPTDHASGHPPEFSQFLEHAEGFDQALHGWDPERALLNFAELSRIEPRLGGLSKDDPCKTLLEQFQVRRDRLIQLVSDVAAARERVAMSAL